jgi:hypothetical protein
VIADPYAHYYGVKVSESTLVPGDDARLGETRFENWLSQSARQIPNTNLQPQSAQQRRTSYDELKTDVSTGILLNQHPDGAGG